MRLFVSSVLISTHTFFLLSNALPFSGLRNETHFVLRKAPYSVVPVDGGQPDESATPQTQIVTKDSTQTVTKSPKTIPPVTETILSTTVVTESELPSTMVVTITSTTTPFITQALVPDAPPSIVTNFATVTSLVSTIDTVSVAATSAPARTPYDNGMWHTTYYKPAEPLDSSGPSSTTEADKTTAAVNDVRSAAFTGVLPNGTYALAHGGKKAQRSFIAIAAGKNTTSTATAVIETMPQMPTLAETAGPVNLVTVPSVDVAKHLVPSFER